ncbi:GNAT family N-acetyltransferase [Microlunatus ginsengisoli]|uniref:GNAT family N-acetyltransferase n=1 Tax=Microlunatus ginsengisoli TaxID=363863 RepID=A0ABP6ZYG0_9ACTN
MRVSTERLDLIPVRPEHAEELVRIHGDPSVAYWFAGAWSADRARTWAADQAEAWREHGVGRWMAYRRTDGVLIGRGGLMRMELAGRPVLDLGWVVRDRYVGQGFATEIGRASAAFGFETLGAAEIHAYTEQDNLASRAVMVKLGMTEVGPMDDSGLLAGIPLDRELAPFVGYRLSRPVPAG